MELIQEPLTLSPVLNNKVIFKVSTNAYAEIEPAEMGFITEYETGKSQFLLSNTTEADSIFIVGDSIAVFNTTTNQLITNAEGVVVGFEVSGADLLVKTTIPFNITLPLNKDLRRKSATQIKVNIKDKDSNTITSLYQPIINDIATFNISKILQDRLTYDVFMVNYDVRAAADGEILLKYFTTFEEYYTDKNGITIKTTELLNDTTPRYAMLCYVEPNQDGDIDIQTNAFLNKLNFLTNYTKLYFLLDKSSVNVGIVSNFTDKGTFLSNGEYKIIVIPIDDYDAVISVEADVYDGLTDVVYTYTLNNSITCDNHTLLFFTDNGCFESYSFKGNQSRTKKVKKEYYQDYLTVNKIKKEDLNNEIEIESGILNDIDADLLSEIINSKYVFYYKNNKMIPVTITNSELEYFDNDKLSNLKIKFEYNHYEY